MARFLVLRPASTRMRTFLKDSLSIYNIFVVLGSNSRVQSNQHFIYRIIEKREAVAYKMKLPAALGGVHDVFHVSQLNECLRVPTEEAPLETLVVQEVRSES